MSRYYNIHIPVKPYIQKFFHPRDGSPIFPNNHPMLWLFIKPYLQYKVQDGISISQRHRQISNLKGKLTIQLSVSKVKLYGIQARPSSIIIINQLLDTYFGKELFWFVSKCEQNTGRYKGFSKTIEDFCQLHNIEIEEDISTESLQNLYKRHRKKYFLQIGSKNIFPVISLPTPD